MRSGAGVAAGAASACALMRAAAGGDQGGFF